jgi:hypothetical protein
LGVKPSGLLHPIANLANYAKIALIAFFPYFVRCYENNPNSKTKRRRRQNYDRPKFRAATGWADLTGKTMIMAFEEKKCNLQQ